MKKSSSDEVLRQANLNIQSSYCLARFIAKEIIKEENSDNEEIMKKLRILEAQYEQVSSYYITPDKEGTSSKPGVSNAVMVNWKKNRLEEIGKEIETLKMEK